MNSVLICNVCLIHILGFTRILKEILVVILCQLYSFIGKGPHNSSDENKAVAKDDAAEIEWINIEAVVDKNLASIINIFYWITRDGKNLAKHFGRPSMEI